eukprot:7388111-Prymnesium_polylepis.1
MCIRDRVVLADLAALGARLEREACGSSAQRCISRPRPPRPRLRPLVPRWPTGGGRAPGFLWHCPSAAQPGQSLCVSTHSPLQTPHDTGHSCMRARCG